jgi:PQQ-like domain
VFAAGLSAGSDTASDYATIAYDASSGAVLWARRYDGPANGDDSATALAASPDGSAVFVTGSSLGLLSSLDYATVAYDAPSGAVLWTRQYNGPGNDYDYATSAAASPDGSALFVTGSSPGSGGVNDYATVAYEP